MAYTALDIVNIKDCIKCLKTIADSICELHHEYCACLIRFESIIERYHDIVPLEQDDLPL